MTKPPKIHAALEEKWSAPEAVLDHFGEDYSEVGGEESYSSVESFKNGSIS